MTKTIGVIGLGSIGSRHAKNLTDLGYSVESYDPAIKGTCDSTEELIELSDAVVIASPTPRHYFDLTDALHELKPVFCEKPIADRLPDFPSTFNKVTMVGYNLRFHSCVKKAKEWLDAGLIGKPLWANFTLGQYNDRPAYLRDGVILNWSHEIDLCLYLLGFGVVAGSATRLTDGKDDMTDILLTHKSGCISTIHLDYITNPERRFFTITGTIGHIDADIVRRQVEFWPADRKKANSEVFYGEDTWNDNYIEEMQAFIDRINGEETIGCSGKEGLRVLEICLEVRKQAGLE